MASSNHRMEQRASLLATRMTQRKIAIRDAITPPGEAPPFSVTKSRSEALSWWSQNYTSPVGKMVIATFSEQQKLELEAALAQHHLENPAPVAIHAVPPSTPPDSMPPMPQMLPEGETA